MSIRSSPSRCCPCPWSAPDFPGRSAQGCSCWPLGCLLVIQPRLPELAPARSVTFLTRSNAMNYCVKPNIIHMHNSPNLYAKLLDLFHGYEILHLSGALVKVSRGAVSRHQAPRMPSGTYVAQAVPSGCCGCPVFGAQGCCLTHPWIRCPDRTSSAAVISAARSPSGLSLALGSACIWFCVERKLDALFRLWLTNTSAS